MLCNLYLHCFNYLCSEEWNDDMSDAKAVYTCWFGYDWKGSSFILSDFQPGVPIIVQNWLLCLCIFEHID